MVPLSIDKNSQLKYITLDEGLASSEFDIEELDDGASVNDIQFHNKSDKFALLFEGEELLGAMQNRILNVSVLVTPHTNQNIPVSCVEAGRWHHKHRDREKQRFGAANRMHYARGRALENRSVSNNLDVSRRYQSDQSGIWSDIDRKSQRMNVSSPSAASDAMYVSSASKIDNFVESLTHTPNQVGSVFLIDGAVSGIELFANESTHKNMIEKLVRSYALDAIDAFLSRSQQDSEKSKEATGDQCVRAAEEFAERLKASWTKQFKGVCAGENFRLKDDGLTGGALVHDDQVLHLCAFALTGEEAPEEQARAPYTPVP